MRAIRVWSLLGQACLVGLFSLFACGAHAQAVLTFSAGGAAVASSTTAASLRAISGTGVTWSAGSSGYVATASAAANASLVNQEGQAIRMAGTAVTRVAANDLAFSLVAGLRAGIPGLLLAAAATGVMYAANYYWDQLQQSMIYAPTPGASSTCSGVPYTPLPDSSGLHYQATILQNGQCVAQYVNISNAPGTIIYFAFGYPVVEQNSLCNNGTNQGLPSLTPIDSNYRCPLAVPDQGAADDIAAGMNSTNGPPVGQAITSAGGQVRGSELPNVQLNPANAPTTTVTNPDGSQSITTRQETANCVQDLCTVTETSVLTQKAPNGSTIGQTTTTTSPDPNSTPSAQDDPNTCGLTQSSACYINETGTPAATTPLPNANALDAPASARVNDLPSVIDATNMDTSIPDVLGVPTSQTCQPFVIPSGQSIDPCGPMEDVRTVMDYLWALAGFWIILGMIKRTIDGG